MKHIAENQVRRYLDEPASLDDTGREHLATCPQCQSALAAAGSDRELVASVLGAPASAPASTDGVGDGTALATDAAWRRLQVQLSADEPPKAPVGMPFRSAHPRWRSLRRPIVAVAAAGALAIGTTAVAVGADWLPIFHPKQVTAVAFNVDDVAALPDLSAYGTVNAPQTSGPEPVASAAQAQQRTGVDVPALSQLPDGVTGDPSYAVIPKLSGTFTFSAAKARAAAERTGQSLPPMPDGVDGSTLRLDAGPGVLMAWGLTPSSGAADIPELAVLRMPAPRASAQGVSLTTLRDYLLTQPGIPASTATQLRKLPDDGTVLPLPIPEQYATSKPVTVDGVAGTLVELKDGSGAGLVWIKDGQLTAVLGLLSADDIQDVAGDLH